MGLFQSIPESIIVFQPLLVRFTPLLQFLCFELINYFKNRNDDDDFDSGINIYFAILENSFHHKQLKLQNDF